MRIKCRLLLLLLLFAVVSCNSVNQQEGVKQGSAAPDIALPDSEGNVQSLGDLQGNLVLLDFWASWCRPCRRLNPELVQLYNRYKNIAFTDANRFLVYSVSLDTDKTEWLRAVKEDKLNWSFNLCDFQGGGSPAAAAYGVEAIPASFLIDAEGVVIGRDLPPHAIEKILRARMVFK